MLAPRPLPAVLLAADGRVIGGGRRRIAAKLHGDQRLLAYRAAA